MQYLHLPGGQDFGGILIVHLYIKYITNTLLELYFEADVTFKQLIYSSDVIFEQLIYSSDVIFKHSVDAILEH